MQCNAMQPFGKGGGGGGIRRVPDSPGCWVEQSGREEANSGGKRESSWEWKLAHGGGDTSQLSQPGQSGGGRAPSQSGLHFPGGREGKGREGPTPGGAEKGGNRRESLARASSGRPSECSALLLPGFYTERVKRSSRTSSSSSLPAAAAASPLSPFRWPRTHAGGKGESPFLPL